MNVAMVSPWNRSAFSLLAHLNASFGVEFELLPLRPRMNIVHPKRLVRLPAMRKLFTAVALLPAGGALAAGRPQTIFYSRCRLTFGHFCPTIQLILIPEVLMS